MRPSVIVSWGLVAPSHTDEDLTRSPLPPTLKLPGTRPRYSGIAASLALHALLLALLVLHGERIWSRTLPPGPVALGDPGSSAGGGGGPRVAYITLPSLPKAETPVARKVSPPVIPPKRVVVPAVPPPKQPETVVAQKVDTVLSTAAEPNTLAATTGAGSRAGSNTTGTGGPGNGNGSGKGASGTGPGGGSGKSRPPEPRDMAFPFDAPPKELRGISLSVTFWVRVDGVVERYTVEPEIKDRDYAKKFDEVMRAFRFTPAQAPDGTRIPGTTRISFTLPGKSSS